MKIAAAYLRVSTEAQDEYSLDSQLKLIRDYAGKNDLIVPEELVFCDDGISGRSAEKRPEFQRMIGCAKDPERSFEMILVWKFSRFARNQEESIVYKSMLQRCGVEVVSVSEPLADGPFGSLIERILEWMDEFYSIRLAGEVRRGMAERISRGEIVTVPSFGYDVDPQTRKYRPNENAATVRRIYAEYLRGKGRTAIARELGAEGVRTTRGKLPENRWVKYVLQNPVYVGRLRWSKGGKVNYSREDCKPENSYIVESDFERIIDEETWSAVQEKISRAARGRQPYQRAEQSASWMLKGLVHCSDCGSTLVYTALDCPSMQCHKYAHGTCSVSHSLSIAKADRLVIEHLESCVERCEFPILPPVSIPSTGADYGQLIAREKQKLRRVREAYEAGVDTLEEYATKKQRLSRELARLEQDAATAGEKAARPDPAAYRSRAADVLQLIKDPEISAQAKNRALRTIIAKIVYNSTAKTLDLYFYE